MNTMLGVAQLLADGTLSPEQRRQVEMLQRAGNQMVALMDRLLANLGVESASGWTDAKRTVQARPDEFAGVRLLVVDDSEDSRALVEAFLAGSGAVLTFADTGGAALDALARETFDIVLMDLHLQDANGLETTRALRRRERERGASPVAVLALSADVLPTSIHRALAAGCSAHLAKPLARAALVEAIRVNRGAAGPSPSPALRERFLARRAREVATAREALRRRDFAALETLGHNLRGNGPSYGFPRLGVLGRRIEAAAQAREVRRLETLLSQFASDVSDLASNGLPAAKSRSGTHARAVSTPGHRVRKREGGH
jgi:CheY-like chemotaxis protein